MAGADSRRCGPLGASVLCAALVAAGALVELGCDGEQLSPVTTTSVTWQTGTGGAGGSTSMCEPPSDPEPEGCVDIFVDPRVLPEPEAWIYPMYGFGRHPFWRDERGLHAVWMSQELGSDRPHVFVTTFDPSTGGTTDVRVHDPFATIPFPSASSIDAAGAPSGAFAFALIYSEDPHQDSICAVIVGHLDEPELRATWIAPWSVFEQALFGVSWDGEAFAVHALSETSSAVTLVRLDEWGNELGAAVEAGRMSSIWEEYSGWTTDPSSGRTWLVSSATGGIWLSGHERDGTPLPGTEAEGRVLVIGAGEPEMYLETWNPAVGTWGEQAMAGWYGHVMGQDHWESRLQVLDGAATSGSAVVMRDQTGWGAGDTRAIARAGEAWWMGVGTSCGLEAFWLGEGDATDRQVLVHLERPDCYPGCEDPSPFFPALSQLTTVTWEDELWLGFLDRSNGNGGATEPYRIVRVKPGCRYPTAFEVDRLGQR